MTIGQRIAQKRKELGLSQEALGEELGVTRQSIYKWGSDAALPEIDKLIALSKRFDVSVGALLGVEEDAPQQAASESDAPTDSELSEAQLHMVEEIVDRYLAAQPKPKARKWPWLLLAFAVLLVSFRLIDRLDQIDQQYQRVQMTVSNVQDSVNNQIYGISNRVEEILKAQNSLTAEYGTEVSATNLEKNQVRFSVHATPKTYVEGMEAKFAVDNHTGGINKASGEEGLNHKFTATLSTDLTDEITLSVTFLYPDGTQQTQVLDTYTYLYSETIPYVSVQDDLWRAELTGDGTLQIPSPYNSLRYAYFHTRRPNEHGVEIADARMGLFKNQMLVAWGTPCDVPENYHGFDDHTFFEFAPLELPLTAEDTVCFAAVLTDQYGRTFVAPGSLCAPVEEDGKFILNFVNDKTPTEWDYE